MLATTGHRCRCHNDYIGGHIPEENDLLDCVWAPDLETKPLCLIVYGFI